MRVAVSCYSWEPPSTTPAFMLWLLESTEGGGLVAKGTRRRGIGGGLELSPVPWGAQLEVESVTQGQRFTQLCLRSEATINPRRAGL